MVITIIGSIIGLIVQLSIWKALYAGNGVNYLVSLRGMVQYSVVSMFISILYDNSIVNSLEEKVRSGQIAIDLIRPVGLARQVIYEQIGKMLFNFLFHFLPMALVAVALLGVHIVKIHNPFYFSISLINGMVLYYLINYLFGLLSFWFISTYPLRAIFDGILRLVSGAFIPLWFLDGAIGKIAQILPFHLLYYLPLAISLDEITGTAILYEVAYQIIWIFLFGVLVLRLDGLCKKKLVIQGG